MLWERLLWDNGDDCGGERKVTRVQRLQGLAVFITGRQRRLKAKERSQ